MSFPEPISLKKSPAFEALVIIKISLTPESFNVLVKEMQALGLDVKPGRSTDKLETLDDLTGGGDDFSLDDLTL